jgi:hypothetical protein
MFLPTQDFARPLVGFITGYKEQWWHDVYISFLNNPQIDYKIIGTTDAHRQSNSRVPSSGKYRRVVRWKSKEFSKEDIFSVFRVEE